MRTHTRVCLYTCTLSAHDFTNYSLVKNLTHLRTINSVDCRVVAHVLRKQKLYTVIHTKWQHLAVAVSDILVASFPGSLPLDIFMQFQCMTFEPARHLKFR